MTQPDPLPPLEPIPLQPIPRARRRRARRTFFPPDAEGQAAILTDLARRAYPSFELYIYALLCGAILGAGYLLDSQAVLFFGILAAPLLTPWVGLTIASITGSVRFFAQTLAALLISVLIVFLIGIAAGFANAPLEPHTINQVHFQSRLWLPNLVILALGALLLIVTFVRTEAKPYLPSAVLAYSFYLPISAAGFGIGARVEGVWPQAAQIFLVHLAWATFFGLLTLAVMRFRPRSFGGIVFSIFILTAAMATILNLTGLGGATLDRIRGTSPMPSEVVHASPAPPTFNISPSPRPTLIPSATSSPIPSRTVPPTLLGGNVTLPATETPTPSMTVEPTPIYAKIKAQGGGAYVRKTPNGQYLLTLENGFIVEVLGENQELDGVIWIHIAVVKNGVRQEGWIMQSLLVTATPIVNWEPTVTPTP